MFQNKKNFRANLKFFYSWGWTWLTYFRVLHQYSSPASLAYADFLSALPPIWSAQVSLQVQTDGFKTKKNFRANLKFFYSWGWTWLPYFRVLRQYSSPASLAYADFLSALPPIWSAQVSLQVQTDGFKTKKKLQSESEVFL